MTSFISLNISEEHILSILSLSTVFEYLKTPPFGVNVLLLLESAIIQKISSYYYLDYKYYLFKC